MTPNEPQTPVLTAIGGEIELCGFIFEVVAHTIDKNGRAAEVPGKMLRKVPKQSKQAERARLASAPNLNTASATTAEPAPPLTSPPRQRKARQSRRTRGDYRRFQRKPPELKIVTEPMSAGAVWGWVAVLALIVSGIWLLAAGSESQKWKTIEGAARAVQGK